MTSPTSVTSRRRGFTLIELLIVIGILGLLAAILVPAVTRAVRAGQRARTGALLQAISAGLEAYYGDFHQQYPPVPAGIAGGKLAAAVLCKALIAPGPEIHDDPSNYIPAYSPAVAYSFGSVVLDGGFVYTYIGVAPAAGIATSNTAYWLNYSSVDGANGPGFREKLVGPDDGFRSDGTNVGRSPNDNIIDRVQGKTYGPYLAPDRFKTNGLAILDTNDKPVLYFPASPGKPIITAGTGYLSNSGLSKYNTDHNNQFFDIPVNMLAYLLGDRNANGRIDVGIPGVADETPAATGPYILWTAGADSEFGIKALTESDATRCDDVTNFK